MRYLNQAKINLKRLQNMMLAAVVQAARVQLHYLKEFLLGQGQTMDIHKCVLMIYIRNEKIYTTYINEVPTKKKKEAIGIRLSFVVTLKRGYLIDHVLFFFH